MEAHSGLGIDGEVWAKFSAHFDASLDKFNFPDELKVELFALLGGVQADVVESI